MNLTELETENVVGVSTGALGYDLAWQDALDLAADTGFEAVELSAMRVMELHDLVGRFESLDLSRFGHVSVHAPVKELPDGSDPVIAGLLACLPDRVSHFVMHPDVIENPEAYVKLGGRFLVENMDSRKNAGHTPDDLQRIFDVLPEAGFCLDVAHAWSVDPSMRLAHALLDRFGPRLREVHVSSLVEQRHHRLLDADRERFRDVLDRCVHVPWVMEAI